MMCKLVLVLAFAATASAAFTCHLRELDICGAGMAAFMRRTAGPIDLEADLKYKCEAVKDVSYCIGNFTEDCMTDEQLELHDFVKAPAKRLFRRFCEEESDLKAGYLKHGLCLRAAGRTQEMRRCVKDAKVGLEVILNAKSTKRPNLKCCTANRFKQCAGDVILNQCGQETIDFIRESMRMAGSRLHEIYCSGYEPDGPMCESLPPSGSSLVGSKGKSPYKILSGLLYASEYGSF